ncbi:MAG: hypothetical protein CMD27_03360 [Flavobacteriales bacterium]|nr:hypothetical protein [Flavobacteriales bacterium]
MKLNFRFQIFLFSIGIFFAICFFKVVDLSLKKYTLHHEIITVPSLIGLNISQVEDTILEYGLQFIILDSAAYDPGYARGSVLSHSPKPGSEVKPGRKIYLTTNPITVNYISFPELINKSLRQTINLLENNAFRLGNLYYVDHFAKDVLIFATHNGMKIHFNDSLPKFSIIDLHLGNGYELDVTTPNLIGLSLKDVKKKLNNTSLNVGDVYLDFNDNDSLASVVYKQDPILNTKLTLGSFISVWAKDSIINK